MLIEDDPLCLDSLSRALRLNEFTPRVFTSPQKALQEYRPDTVDAVITDYHLPGLNGIQLLTEIKKKNPQAVVIMISGDRGMDLPLRAISQGARAFFTKPIDIQKIIDNLSMDD